MAELFFILFIIFIVKAIFLSNDKIQSKKKPFKNEKESKNRKQEKQEKHKQYNEPDNRSDEEILGLSSVWTKKDLKAAYQRKCGQLHPDKWEKMPTQMQTMMLKEFKIVQQSYKNLLKRK